MISMPCLCLTCVLSFVRRRSHQRRACRGVFLFITTATILCRQHPQSRSPGRILDIRLDGRWQIRHIQLVQTNRWTVRRGVDRRRQMSSSSKCNVHSTIRGDLRLRWLLRHVLSSLWELARPCQCLVKFFRIDCDSINKSPYPLTTSELLCITES